MSTTGSGRAAARGALRERPVARLLYQLLPKRVTGRVLITDAAGEATEVYVREGAVVHVRRADEDDRLDKVLVDCGILPEAIVAEASAAATAAGRRLGEVLIERGALTAAALGEVLRAQVRRKVAKLFAVRDGTFEIFLDPHPYGEAAELAMARVDPRVIIPAAIRAAYDDARLTAELAPLAGLSFRLVGVTPNVLEAMGLPPSDPTVQALQSRRLTLDDLATVAARPSDARAIALALLYTDLLETRPAAPPAPARAPAPAAPAPAAPALAAPAPAGDPGQRASILALAEKLDTLTPFDLLGVTPASTPDEINTAYMRAARQYHPDRLAGAGLRDLVPVAERIMGRITDAASTLNDPAKRAELTAAPAKKAADTAAHAILDAERTFQRGEALMKKGDFTRAAECFTEAMRTNPAEPQYRAYHAWARWADPRASKADTTTRTALKTIEEIVKDQPTFALGHYWIGQIRTALGEPDRAARAFKEALAQNKDLYEAERELRLLTMRKEKASPSGVFGKLFKK